MNQRLIFRSARITRRIVTPILILMLILAALTIPPATSTYAATTSPHITYARLYSSGGNIYGTFCIVNATVNHYLAWGALDSSGQLLWNQERTYGALNGCRSNVWFFSKVTAGNRLVIVIGGVGTGSEETAARFYLYPGTGSQLNQCSVQTLYGDTAFIRDPRYRWDTAAGVACAFVDPRTI